MSDKVVVTSPKLSPPRGVYSHAVRTPPARALLFISGLTAQVSSGRTVAPGDIKGQTRQVLENMKALLQEAGATLEDVVKVTVFVRNIEDFARIHEVRREYFPHDPPASSMVEISRLVQGDALIEIEAIALLPK